MSAPRTATSRFLRHPLTQFLLAGLVILLVVLVAVGRLVDRAASDEVLYDARARTELLAKAIAEPFLSNGLATGNAGAIDRFDAAVLQHLHTSTGVRRVKVWGSDGTILYSDQTQLIGTRYDLGEDEVAVLAGAPTKAEVSDLSKSENRFERRQVALIEVYTQVHTPNGTPLLFEVYYTADDLAVRRTRILSTFRPLSIAGMVALVVLTTPLLWVLTRRLDRNARDRERLLQAAIDASEAERRRIARDLHDTVVQDLAGTAFALTAYGRGGAGAPAPSALESLAGSIRESLRGIRSLMVEIYPPNLQSNGLRASLLDLSASQPAGVDLAIDVEGEGEVPPHLEALCWRVAQEAVRNALRHAACSRVLVAGRRVADEFVLRIEDDGIGFVPDVVPEGHFGLRGLADLVQEAGGTLRLESAPGEGTTVEVRVAAR